MDVLSDVLRAVRLTGAIYFDIDASSPWVGESPGTAEIAAAVMPGGRTHHFVSRRDVGFLLGRAGRRIGASTAPERRRCRRLSRRRSNVMSSSPGLRGEPNPIARYCRPIGTNLPFALMHGGGGDERTRFVCGYLGCDARPFNPLARRTCPTFSAPASLQTIAAG